MFGSGHPNTRKIIVLLLIYKTITLWFPCLDGLIQTLGNLNSRNIPACLDQAIQTRKSQSNCIFPNVTTEGTHTTRPDSRNAYPFKNVGEWGRVPQYNVQLIRQICHNYNKQHKRKNFSNATYISKHILLFFRIFSFLNLFDKSE